MHIATPRVVKPVAMMMLTNPNRCPSSSTSSASVGDIIPASAREAVSTSSSTVVTCPLQESAGVLDLRPQVLSALQVQNLASDLLTLVNGERLRRGIHPLIPCKSLETFARMEAEAMAETGKVKPWFQSLVELEELLKSPKVGENICLADSVELLHQNVVANPEQFLRLLSSEFTEIGVAVCQGHDNKLYLCQLFRHQVPQEPTAESSSSPTSR